MADSALPPGWRNVSLEGLLSDPKDLTYGVVQPGSPVPDGVPIVRVKDVRDGRVDRSDPLRIAPEIEAAYSRSRLQGGELLVTLVGTVGEVAVAPKEMRGWNTARAVATVRLSSADEARWVGYCISSPDGRERIGARVNTTVQTTLNLKDLREFPVVLPPDAERQAVAEVLGALDNKIESNRRLVEVAQSLCDALVVQVSTAATMLGSVAEITMGSSPPGSTYNETGDGMPFYQGVADFGVRSPRRRVYCSAPVRMALPGDSLVSVRAPVGRLNRTTEQCCIGRGLAALRSSAPTLLYYALRANDAVWAPYNAEGTVFGAIKAADLQQVEVPWPRQVDLPTVEEELSTIDARLTVAFREIDTLVVLRDTLLPELLSGRLRVREAEKVIEDVV